MVTLTTMQLIFAIIMIWTAGFAIGAVVVTRIITRKIAKRNTTETLRNLHKNL